MDVRCERCKTEYEFEDARITEAGVTVRCTTCEHVFVVKKRAIVVTVPVKQGGGDAGVPLTQPATPPAAASSREWRVRTADGNVFQFRELTTLQKWIVERKVMREDEISQNGESWKRLGSIAELASFFQVVDEAQSAQQLRAKADVASVVLAPDAAAAPPPESLRPPAPRPVAVRPPQRTSAALTDAERAEVAPAKKSGGWLWALLLLLLAAGGGGAYAYVKGLLPLWALPSGTLEPGPVPAPPPLAEAPAPLEDAGSPVAVEQVDGGASAEAERVDAGAVAEVVDPGTPAADGGTGTPPPAGAPEFDTLLKQGDRLRMRERASAALSAYARAIQADPTRAEPHAGRGLVLLDQGDSLKAEAAFQQALQLNPSYGIALIGLAETYRLQGRGAEAIEYYQRYLEVLPSGPEAGVARSAIERLKQ